MENRADFTGRVVVDVGAGSGILSLFAAQVLLVIVDGLVLFSFLKFLFLKYNIGTLLCLFASTVL